jgi:hypothetical protein
VNLDQHLLLVHHLHDLADVRAGLSLKIAKKMKKSTLRYNLTFLLCQKNAMRHLSFLCFRL